MNKYGTDKFTFKILEECEDNDLDTKELYWIEQLNTLIPNGYNVLKGGRKLYGKNNPFYGKMHSNETKKKISIKNTGRKADADELKMRHIINSGSNNPFYGKAHTQSTKEKIRATNIEKGTYLKSSIRMKLKNPNNGCNRRLVIMLSKDKKILNYFISAKEAGDYIKSRSLSKAKFPSNSICDVCRGIQKSAFGYYWTYSDFPLITNLSENTTGFIIRKGIH